MGLKKVKIHEIYLGRWIIFLILGLLQSTLIALGDLYYLGIQCAHTFLFYLGAGFKYSLCHDQLYADGFIWRYRKSRQCGFTCYAGCGNWWNFPD